MYLLCRNNDFVIYKFNDKRTALKYAQELRQIYPNVHYYVKDVKNKKTESQQQLQGDVTTASVKPVKDAVYDVDVSSEVVDITEDMRRAVIAHEILKRKFYTIKIKQLNLKH